MDQVYSGAIQRKESRPSLHLAVVATEKGAFESPSTTVANYNYIYIYIYINRIWHQINSKSWYAMKLNWIKPNQLLNGTSTFLSKLILFIFL